jgi:hypothetical protein
MPVTTALNDLRNADAEDRAAKAEALYRGVTATQPLTVTRLRELCELGEKMIRAATRRDRALARLRLLLG